MLMYLLYIQSMTTLFIDENMSCKANDPVWIVNYNSSLLQFSGTFSKHNVACQIYRLATM